MFTSPPVRRRTMQDWTVGDFFKASSTVALRGSSLPLLQPPSAVICIFAEASLLRSAIAALENPPKND